MVGSVVSVAFFVVDRLERIVRHSDNLIASASSRSVRVCANIRASTARNLITHCACADKVSVSTTGVATVFHPVSGVGRDGRRRRRVEGGCKASHYNHMTTSPNYHSHCDNRASYSRL